ncbi:hypothetical protein CHLRE_01g040533v5 [Chlamydomonas reinhardtii]|uniref:Uncharacterized protein n=1 Tax=Chlamydomonas reinhardtii TaxID=3055 RepID=A0A2K3E7C8_CHLRE|nr:uncharacterized protein CHLRE_01g040533v5 [Chlamydomonas reinhardtii]PNW88691.1 hypothetical protein CHLRE_01g040533v5 [Chlamydomonas reinhardtii]
MVISSHNAASSMRRFICKRESAWGRVSGGGSNSDLNLRKHQARSATFFGQASVVRYPYSDTTS